MAPPVYTITLIGGSATPGSPLSFTVPAGHRYIMVDILSVAYNAIEDAGFCTIDVDGQIIQQWSLAGYTGPRLNWSGRAAFNPGDIVNFEASPSVSSWDLWVTGYDLSLP